MKNKDSKLTLVKNDFADKMLSRTAMAIPPSGIREFFDIVYSTPDCISLGVGEPDFTTPWRISDMGIDAIKQGYTHYTPNRGLPELRQCIIEYIKTEFDLSYDPDTEIIITMGVSQGLDLALRSIINPGDEVLIPEPCYVSYPSTVALLHGVPIMIPTRQSERFRVNPEELTRHITPRTKAVLLNYPSNPTGATIDPETLERIADIAIDRGLLILSDEIYSAIIYDRAHMSIASIPGMKEQTIYLNGFSKSHAMTGWRLGFIAAPKALSDVMLKIHQYTALCAPSFAQLAAIEALRKGKKDVNLMLAEYTKRRNYIASRFNDIGLDCLVPEGAFYVFPDIGSTGMSGRDFAMGLLKKEKVAVVPGIVFGESGEGHIRCSYATSMENITEALIRIERYLRSL